MYSDIVGVDPSSSLKNLVNGGIEQVIGVVRHRFHAQSQDEVQNMFAVASGSELNPQAAISAKIGVNSMAGCSGM